MAAAKTAQPSGASGIFARMSPRVVGTILVAVAIVAILVNRLFTKHALDRVAYEWFGLPAPVQVSLDANGRHYTDLGNTTVKGTYVDDVDPESIRVRQADGTDAVVAFIGKTDLAQIREHPGAAVAISSPDGFHAQVAQQQETITIAEGDGISRPMGAAKLTGRVISLGAGSVDFKAGNETYTIGHLPPDRIAELTADKSHELRLWVGAEGRLWIQNIGS